jgi:hypothetical protein
VATGRRTETAASPAFQGLQLDCDTAELQIDRVCFKHFSVEVPGRFADLVGIMECLPVQAAEISVAECRWQRVTPVLMYNDSAEAGIATYVWERATVPDRPTRAVRHPPKQPFTAQLGRAKLTGAAACIASARSRAEMQKHWQACTSTGMSFND